jgi:hypothetical protein
MSEMKLEKRGNESEILHLHDRMTSGQGRPAVPEAASRARAEFLGAVRTR